MMLYNKNYFRKDNDKKVLHKIKKQWVTISLALLVAIGGGATATQAHASADPSKSNVLASRIRKNPDQLRGDNHASDEVHFHVNDQHLIKLSPAEEISPRGNQPGSVSVDYNQISSANDHLKNDLSSFSSVDYTVNSAASVTSNDSSDISSLSNLTKNQSSGELTSEDRVAQSVSNSVKTPLATMNTNSISMNSLSSSASSICNQAKIDASNNNETALNSELSSMNTEVSDADSIISGIPAIINSVDAGMSSISSMDNDANQQPAVNVIQDISDHASDAASYSAKVSSVSNELTALSQTVIASYGVAAQTSLMSAINAYGNSAADQSLISYSMAVGSLNSILDSYNALSGAGFKSVSQAASDAQSQLVVASKAILQGDLSVAVNDASQANGDDSTAGVINTMNARYQSAVDQLSGEDANADQLLASLSQSANDGGAFPVNKYKAMISDAAQSADQMSNAASSAASKISANLSTFNSMSSSASLKHNTDQLYQSCVSDFSSANSFASMQADQVSSVVDLISDESSEVSSYTAKNPQATSLDNNFASSANSTVQSAEKVAGQAADLGSQAAHQTDLDLNSLNVDENGLDPSVASSQAIQDSKACDQDNSIVSSASHAVSVDDTQIDNDNSAISSLGKAISQSNHDSADSAVNAYVADASSVSQTITNTKSTASVTAQRFSEDSASASSAASEAVSAAQKNGSASASKYAQSADLSRKAADSAAQSESSLALQANKARSQVDRDLDQVKKIADPQQNHDEDLIDPERLSMQDVDKAISGLQSGERTGIITLVTSGVSSPRYVINFHPGEKIRITPEDDKSIDKDEEVPVYQAADGVLYAFDSHQNKVTEFYHDSSNHALPSLDDIQVNYTVHPRMQFWFDNGDGTKTLVQNGDSGIPFHVDSKGEIIVPQTISGHYDEPHDVSMQSITGSLYPSLYPHFRTETKVFRMNAQGNYVIDVVFGKGQDKSHGNDNTPINDDTNYWLGHNWTIPMIARRYFTHVVYIYNGQKYDFSNYQNGFKGDQIQNISGALQQAKAAHKINPNLNIDPNYQMPNFDPQNSGTRSNPGTVYVPLVTNTRANVQIPILLRNVKDRDYPINNTKENNPHPAYLSTVNLDDVRYDRNNPYYINKNNITPQLSSDQKTYIRNIDHDDPSSFLKHSFLVSGGQLNTTSKIGGPDDPETIKSQWTDLDQAGNGLQGSYSKKGIQANNIGSYTLTQNDVNSLERNGQNFGNNQPYAGEKIPVLYFDQFKNSGQNDLINIPHVHYNYRFWEPLDHAQDSVYDQNFVDRGRNGYLSSGVNNINTDINDNGSKDGLNDQNCNAHNYWTWFNQNLTDVSGNLAPNGFIAGVNSWSTRDHFNAGSSDTPENNWYLMFTNGQNDQGVQIHYLKGTPQGLEVSGGNSKAFKGSNSNGQYYYVKDLGVADGYSNNNGLTQSINSAKSGQYPTVSVTYNQRTYQFPKNATILADRDGLCSYTQDTQHKSGVYKYSDSDDPINLVEDRQPINYQDSSQNNNSYYLGDMNAYAQPMSYTVQFSGSGNYSNGGQVTKNNQEVNKYWMYPNFDNSNNNAYSAGPRANYSVRAYAGDRIRFIPDNNSDDSRGSFYLIHNGDGSKQRLPLQIPDYQPNSGEDSATQDRQRRNHQLFYDRQAEHTFLDHNSTAEAGGQNPLADSNGSDPEWTIDPYDPDYQIWPNGYPKTHNSTAVVYLYDQEESYDNLIHFMNMDTGTALNVKYSHNNDSSSTINTLFQNHKFDMSSFLWNQVQGEQDSFLKKDGSWQLSQPLKGGGYKNYYIIRTDAPGNPNSETVNNTYIYVASQDYNDPNVQAVLPVTIQYVDQDGNHISPIGNDQGAHDLTTYGYLHGYNGSSLDNAIHDNITKQSGNSIQGNNLIDRTRGHLWDYQQAGYQEVGRLPGNYQSDYSKSIDSHNDDASSSLFNETKPIHSFNGDDQPIQKSVFGSYPIVTIVLEKKLGQNNFQINYVDEDDPHRENSQVASDLNGLDGYANGTSTAASTAPAVTPAGSLTGSSLASALQRLSNSGYQLDYYVSNAQDSGAKSASANTIGAFENANQNGFKDNGQVVDIYLKHKRSASTSSADFNQQINYQLENASGKPVSQGPKSYRNSLSFGYTQNSDEVTHSVSSSWTSSGKLSDVVSPSNGIYKLGGINYYVDSSSVSAPNVKTSGKSILANPNGVKGVKSSGPNNDLTYTYKVIYKPAVSSSDNETFSEEIRYVVHSSGASAPQAPSAYHSTETFARSGTYNPWNHRPVSVTAWKQSGSFAARATASLSGYNADVSEVAAPSADADQPNGNTDYGMTFSYVVNYYPQTSSNSSGSTSSSNSNSGNLIPGVPTGPLSPSNSSSSSSSSNSSPSSSAASYDNSLVIKPASSGGSKPSKSTHHARRRQPNGRRGQRRPAKSKRRRTTKLQRRRISRSTSRSNPVRRYRTHRSRIHKVGTVQLEHLRKTDYRRYRRILEGRALGLFGHESQQEARRSSRQYVNGIADALNDKRMRNNYDQDYAAGYSAYRQVAGHQQPSNRNGKLPQTGEQKPMTLAAAVMMILSFFLGASAFVDRKRKS